MEPIKFQITADAETLDRAAIDALKTKPTLAVKMTDSSFFIWKTGEKRNGISGRWYIEDDGTCVYQPKGLSWFYGTGEVALTLSEEASCTAVFTIEERSFLYWIPIGFVLFSLFLLWCIIGWIRQPKFNNQIMEIVVYTKFGSAIQESPRIKVMKRRIGLIPYRACRMRVGDLVFIAAPGRKIVLDKDCVRGRVVYSGKVRFMGRSAGNMKRLLRMMEPAKRDVRMVRGMELYVAPDKNAQAADWITVLQGKQKGMGIGMDAYEQMGRELFEKSQGAPILLIGMGGVGGRIVAQIDKMLAKSPRRDKVAILAIDTNVSLQKLREREIEIIRSA